MKWLALFFLTACVDESEPVLYVCKRPGDVFSYAEVCAASADEANAVVEPPLTCEATGYTCRREGYP